MSYIIKYYNIELKKNLWYIYDVEMNNRIFEKNISILWNF